MLDENDRGVRTLARAGADPDTAAVCLCLTRGEASSMGPQRGLTPAQVAELRTQRLALRALRRAARQELRLLPLPLLPP